jgi:hypothetical protein
MLKLFDEENIGTVPHISDKCFVYIHLYIDKFLIKCIQIPIRFFKVFTGGLMATLHLSENLSIYFYICIYIHIPTYKKLTLYKEICVYTHMYIYLSSSGSYGEIAYAWEFENILGVHESYAELGLGLG